MSGNHLYLLEEQPLVTSPLVGEAGERGQSVMVAECQVVYYETIPFAERISWRVILK